MTGSDAAVARNASSTMLVAVRFPSIGGFDRSWESDALASPYCVRLIIDPPTVAALVGRLARGRLAWPWVKSRPPTLPSTANKAKKENNNEKAACPYLAD